MRRLQAVQNAAARLITGTRRRDHITPILRQLHWLAVCQRAEFKLAMLVFKSLHGLAPLYLVDDCQLVTASGRRQLRSSDTNTCIIRRNRTHLGDRSFKFAVAGPRLWSSLPVGLRHLNFSIGQFRSALKSHLFNSVTRLVTFSI